MPEARRTSARDSWTLSRRGGGGDSALELQAQPLLLAQQRGPQGGQLVLRRSQVGHNCTTTVGQLAYLSAQALQLRGL